MSIAAILERAGLRPQLSPAAREDGDVPSRMDKGVPEVPIVPTTKTDVAPQPAANDETAGSAAWTWPNGPAWNAQEIELFTQRAALLNERGMSTESAESLAEDLLMRDRDFDDRRLCIECTHYLRGRCTNWKAAGFGKAADATALGDYASTLKRCPGFADVLHQGGKS